MGQRRVLKIVRRVRLPAGTVRLRLTALYGSVFLLSGVGLLALTYLLVRHVTPTLAPASRATSTHLATGQSLPANGLSHLGPTEVSARGALERQRAAELHQLLLQSGIALAVMTVVSAILGWLLAGRVLSPVRTITARTRQISADSLHERLSLTGPRDEFHELADTIDHLLTRLQDAFELQRQFVANASHELRTPMAIMRTRLDVALTSPEGVPPQTRALNTGLRTDLDRAERLLESFLMLARAQHGTLTERTNVSLDEVVSAALAGRRDRIAERQLEVDTEIAPVDVAGSRTLLARMIENAVRHNHAHGTISITCTVDRGQSRLIVESGGPVLNHREVAQLAQPFRRLGADRTGSQTGHGLGLAIVAAVATAHGGSLQLHARPQGGLHVEITLPAMLQPARSTVAT